MAMAAAPRPKSPPAPPDPCGRHRLQLAVDALHREIGFLEGEINSIEGIHAASRCCREVDEFIGRTPDPFITISSEKRSHDHSHHFLKKFRCLCRASACCLSYLSWICCCSSAAGGCSSSSSSFNLKRPSCCCNCNCNCCSSSSSSCGAALTKSPCRCRRRSCCCRRCCCGGVGVRACASCSCSPPCACCAPPCAGCSCRCTCPCPCPGGCSCACPACRCCCGVPRCCPPCL
uniref:Seed length and weight protein long form for short seed n=3 Tax=Oryza sativa TaxID=4530 RepID=C6L6D8_ORYSJ|nr:seed length and weight protein long form for short seed [Oryza sativa Indica Group]BAH89241.1 seed length and weight protein long form for short seed [Oryza sativa Japonica Group]BAH89207.1 seed length and weight protein long form for short seed [Oryza sativa Indica Group]BAH89208.1 seed length and weight protein long form for short seed [Oryza sativa Indica Group]BAH89209.1 seed length and weight protein long form for short seed [Oryza sativa Indica Group]